MDYHVLDQRLDRKKIKVVFHIPIPGTGNNSAGVQWRDAFVLVAKGPDNITSFLPDQTQVPTYGISATELADMKAGAIVEYVEDVQMSSTSLTPAERRAEIEARYSVVEDDVTAELQITLENAGYYGNVV